MTIAFAAMQILEAQLERDHFISPQSLEQRLHQPGLKILCNFMAMPGTDYDGQAEYRLHRIPGAIYFDIDEIADKSIQLPHMVAKPEKFAEYLGAMGVSDDDEIVVYDKPGLFSSARVWWNLRIMGARTIRILEGGFDRWLEEGRPVDKNPPEEPVPATFNVRFDPDRIINAEQLLKLIEAQEVTILDARSRARFLAEVDEPRPSLRKGHMPGAHPMPFTDLIKNGSLIENNKLKEILKPFVELGKPVVTSCGSGVTAAILSMALISAGYDDHQLYDGSWTEWADPNADYPVISGKTER